MRLHRLRGKSHSGRAVALLSAVLGISMLGISTASWAAQTPPQTPGGGAAQEFRDWAAADLVHITEPLERGGPPTAATLERGAALYVQRCSICHGDVPSTPSSAAGPTLAQLLMRFSAAETLGQILAPSDFVAQDYRLRAVELTDGRLVDGVVVDEDESHLVLRIDPTDPDQTVDLTADLIRDSWVVELSPMPEGLLGDLSDHEIGELLAYILWAPP